MPGTEGCTPGYWKQQKHFDSWVNYTPNQTLESVFDVPDVYNLDTKTMLQALNFNGGAGQIAGHAHFITLGSSGPVECRQS